MALRKTATEWFGRLQENLTVDERRDRAVIERGEHHQHNYVLPVRPGGFSDDQWERHLRRFRDMVGPNDERAK